MVAFPDGRVAYNRESAIDILGDYGLTDDDATEFAALVLESELTTLYNQVQDARKGDNRGADIFRSVRIAPITADVVHVYYGEHWASIASNDCAIAEWLESLD